MPDDTPDEDVRAALADLTFLNPAVAPVLDPMPADVWTRLQGALDNEAADRAAANHPNVVVLTPANRPSRGMRWAGGLVAASVAIVAVGLAVGTMRSDSQDVVAIAGGAASPTALSADERVAELGATPEAMVAEDTTAALAVPPAMPAARMVMSSTTNYLPEQLRGQVVSLVKDAGFTTPKDAMEKVVPPVLMPVESGFTASWEALRACLTWLTNSPDSQALIVDRATYAGHDAGVIVAPATAQDADSTTPSPTVTMDTGYGAFDVWVVNPDCKQIEDNLDDFPLYDWQP